MRPLLIAHAQVHDGEQGEDEGLDRSDEQLVEGLPDQQADPRQVGRDQVTITETIRTPEKMLPKSRKVSVIGLVISSMMLIGVKRGVGLGVVPEVAVAQPGP